MYFYIYSSFIMAKKSVSKSKSKSNSKSNSQSIDHKTIRIPIKPEELLTIQQTLENKRNKRKTLRKTISKHIHTLKPKIRSRYLKSICSDAGVCIAFGKEQKKMREHFRNFQDFNLIDGYCKKIGKSSANGFVYEIPFTNADYTSYCVLKSSSNANSDNLLYEYLVGQYVNILGTYFPVFVETYGLFEYTNGRFWQYAKDNQQIRSLSKYIRVVKDAEDKLDDLIPNSCENPLQYCVLIQHLRHVVTMNDALNRFYRVPEVEVIYALFQIYFCLHNTRDMFTHYDLHASNVLLYEPVQGKLIRYTYHLGNNESITFESAYIPKIIDYGRCFVAINDSIHHRLCDAPECNQETMVENSNQIIKEKCGNLSGYDTLKDEVPEFTKYNISSLHPNCSHDLRLYNYIRTFGKLNIMRYMKRCIYIDTYGTPPVETNRNPNYISNVSDCYHELLDKMKSLPYMMTHNVIAHLHVYPNKEMKVEYLQ
jgi:hypothetical protein